MRDVGWSEIETAKALMREVLPLTLLLFVIQFKKCCVHYARTVSFHYVTHSVPCVFFLKIHKEFFIILSDCVRYFQWTCYYGNTQTVVQLHDWTKRETLLPPDKNNILKDLLCLASKEYTQEGRKVVLRADGPKDFGTN